MMKVADVVGVCFLIMAVANGSPYVIIPEINKIDGRIQCSYNSWGEKVTYHLGQIVYKPTTDNEDCVKCGPCTKSGMLCQHLFRACPSDDNISGDFSEEDVLRQNSDVFKEYFLERRPRSGDDAS